MEEVTSVGLSSIVDQLLQCKDTHEEMEVLSEITRILKLEKNDQNIQDVANEKERNLAIADFDKFFIYLFSRRYGWSEGVSLSCLRISQSNEVVLKESLKISTKESLIKNLDCLIKWMSSQPVSPLWMKGYMKLVQEAADLPIVRNRSVLHILSWFITSDTSTHLNDEDVFYLFKDFLVVMLTDVWSAIRKSCSRQLGSILACLTPDHQRCVWQSLVEVCEDDSREWQATDGAVLGIWAAVQHYSCQETNIESNIEMPSFVRDDLMSVVFHVISNPQISVRDSAVKAVSAYVSAVDRQERVDILDQTLALLMEEKYQGQEFLDAYTAEGLLNVNHSVLKVLPLDSVVQRWDQSLSTLLLYLSHPASSVRQSASSVFKLLGQKCSSNVMMFCELLHTLTKDWHSIMSSTHETDSVETVSWQGKEGRMLAVEVICSFLIKNHIRTMFCGKRNRKGENLQTSIEDSRISCCPKQAASEPSVESSPFIADSCQSVIQQMKLTAKQSDMSSPSKSRRKTPSCHSLLLDLLYEACECLADDQWELHRIAQQVLPRLAEVVRWYDCSLLEQVWQRHLTSDTNMTTYLSVFLLKETLYHCVRLEPLLQGSQTVKTPGVTESVQSLLECVTRNTVFYLPQVELLLNRPCFDRLSVLSAEVIVMAHRLFEIDTKQKHGLSLSVLTFWQRLFVFAHPHSRITRDLLGPSKTEFSSPYQGYLSCCLVKPEGDSQCARQVEKLFVRTVCGHLHLYMSCLPWTDVSAYLPLIMYNIGLISDDTPVCKTLIRCLQSQSRQLIDKVLTDDSSDRQTSLKSIYSSLRDAAGIVAMKTLESQLLQKVLNLYLVLCQAIRPSKHLKLILRAICARLGKVSKTLENTELSPRHDPDPSLLWHDSPVLLNSGGMCDIEDEDEDDDIFAGGDLPALYSECLSLNVSNSSGHFLSGRPRTTSVQSDVGDNPDVTEEASDSSDDWDSWSDEEQDDDAISKMFSLFLCSLKKCLGQDGSSIFETQVEGLEEEDKSVIRRLAS